jgi:hypothetical protein
MNKKNRIILLVAMIVAAVSQTFAQGNGLAGINEATSMVTSYFDPGTKLIYAIGAVVAFPLLPYCSQLQGATCCKNR